MTTFRVMTYNLHSCRGWHRQNTLDSVLETLRFYNPDVLLAQELDRNFKRTGFLDQPGILSNQLKMNLTFHPRFSQGEGDYGIGIFSKFPINIVKEIDFKSNSNIPSSEKTVAIWAKLTLENGPLNVLTTHFMHSLKDRSIQSDVLINEEWLQHPDCRNRTIFGGDLNSIYHSNIYRKFAHHLQDVLGGANIFNGGTWPSLFPIVRLDHLMTTPDIKIQKAFIPHTKMTVRTSDHLPIVADLEIL